MIKSYAGPELTGRSYPVVQHCWNSITSFCSIGDMLVVVLLLIVARDSD